MQEKHKANLELKNEKLRENQYKVGDLVLKQVMQPLMTGTRHALDCRYTGPYEIIAIDNSSATLDSPTAKFTSPLRCHVDQLKPFILPTSPTTCPTWDEALKHQMNLHNNPVSNRLRKRKRTEATTNPQSAKKQPKLAFMPDEDTNEIMDRIPEPEKIHQKVKTPKKMLQDNAATITLPDSIIPPANSEDIETQEENDNSKSSTSSIQKRRVIPATRRATRQSSAGTVGETRNKPTQLAEKTDTPATEEGMDTTNAPAHKKATDNETVHEQAQADRPGSPITVGSQQPKEADKIEEAIEDSNLSRSVATQTGSSYTSQAVQTTDLSQERV